MFSWLGQSQQWRVLLRGYRGRDHDCPVVCFGSPSLTVIGSSVLQYSLPVPGSSTLGWSLDSWLEHRFWTIRWARFSAVERELRPSSSWILLLPSLECSLCNWCWTWCEVGQGPCSVSWGLRWLPLETFHPVVFSGL